MSVAVNVPGPTFTVKLGLAPAADLLTPGPKTRSWFVPTPLPEAVRVVATGQVRLNTADAAAATVLGAAGGRAAGLLVGTATRGGAVTITTAGGAWTVAALVLGCTLGRLLAGGS